MGTAIKRRLWALGCALSLLLCVPLVKPWLDMGTIDDVSYTRSAQLLAETGHIIYNGWAAPILGWHLYWGALFIKLFGFSFNVTRLSTLPVAMAAAFLSQRSMVRAGLTEWNATLATLTISLSPLFLPLTFSYMTDMGGYFVLVLCFYACLRTLQAETDRQACCWIAFAAISNAVGGTIRQTGWLGLLVIIPPTLWLVRERKKVLLCGVVSLVLGLGIMAGVMDWYKHQPRIMSEPVWRGPLTKDKLRNTIRTIARTLFDAPVFLLPVLLPFFPKLRWRERHAWLTVLAGGIAISALLLLIQHQPPVWLEPTIGNYVTERGVLTGTRVHGWRPVLLGDGVRFVLSVLVIVGVSAVGYVLKRNPSVPDEPIRAPLIVVFVAPPRRTVFGCLYRSDDVAGRCKYGLSTVTCSHCCFSLPCCSGGCIRSVSLAGFRGTPSRCLRSLPSIASAPRMTLFPICVRVCGPRKNLRRAAYRMRR